MMRRLTAVGLSAVVLVSLAWSAEEPLTAEERAKREKQVDELNKQMFELYQAGKPAEAVPLARQALAIREQLYPGMDHPDLATSLNDLALLLHATGEYGQALPYHEKALAMNERLYLPERYPNGHPELASSLNNLGGLLSSMGEHGQALPCYEKALAMKQRLYPPERYKDGHPELALSLSNLGTLLQKMGEYGKALPYLEKALAMTERLYPPERYPGGHPHLATSLNNLGALLQLMGESGKALPFYEKALAMMERLYPPERYKDGHPALATSLNNLGSLLKSMGEYGKALPYFEKALAMRQRLYPPERYPNGHPQLARSLNNLGSLLELMGEHSKALSWYEKALAMNQRLYPPERFKDGHPELATSLHNLGGLLHSMGEYGKALPYSEKDLAMTERLYPPERYRDGHPELASSLSNLGGLLQSMGENGKALPYLQRGLRLYTRQVQREVASAPEVQALALVRSFPRTKDANLSVAWRLPVAERQALHADVWPTKGLLLDLVSRRHQSAQAAAAPETRQQWEQLIAVRRQLNRLAVEPGNDPNARARRLTELADKQERLERDLATILPTLARHQRLSGMGPQDLQKVLERGTAFVDIYRHGDWDKGKFVGYRYQAFLLAPGRDGRCVDLGPAAPIDEAIASWRGSIDRLEDSRAPQKLKSLVWDKLVEELEPGTTVVYLSPEGDLTRLPWPALPGAKPGTILLEERTIAVVPSGKWLLEQLLFPQMDADAPDNLVVAGDIDYGQPAPGKKAEYPQLTQTSREMKRVLDAFGSKEEGLQKRAATPAALGERLKQARYAHLATHGYFDVAGVRAENKRLREQVEKWSLGADRATDRIGVYQHPYGFVGLALAGANDPRQAADGGILTGLGIVDLPLEKLKLCVLSACETGLGELIEEEGGVNTLQRAFHVAGCPNVIGSLWKVNDEATAALMAQFYHELRVNKRTPLEALREAQLTIYRHPERIQALAGERGRPILDETARKGSAATPLPPGETAKTTPTRLWAAFVLSGVGK